jgi:endo-1,4-beta-xylanase
MNPRLPKSFLPYVLRLLPIAACTVATPASAQNLISNGTFEGEEIGPWWGHADEGAEAVQTLEVVEGRMCSTVAEGEAGTDPWHVIIGLSEVPLVANQHYRFSVSASATTAREIRVKTGLGDAPYTDYILQRLNVTTEPQTFTFTYLNIREDAEAQLQFQVGGHVGQLCLDDIVFEPVDPPEVPAYVTPSMTGHPLKAYTSVVKMGTAVDTPIFLTNPQHNAIVAGEFSMITPANSMKMANIQPAKGVYDFTDTQALKAWADEHNIEFHGHPFIWHTQAPNWLVDDTELDREAMLEIMYDHIDKVSAAFPGLPYWDVVNEAIDQVPSDPADPSSSKVWGYRPTIWHDRIGPDFIDLAFQRARMANPTSKLLYNDYNIEQKGNAKADRVYELIADMKTRGIPVDAVGFQSHYYVTAEGGTSGVPNMQAIKDNMARYAELGVEVHITECDFRIGKPLDDAKAQMQAKFYAELLQVCIDAPNCSHFTVWGLSDLDSWVPSTFPEYDFAHLFDSELKPKSAYHAMTQVFSAYPADSGPVGGTGGADGAGAASGAGGGDVVGAGGLGAGAETGAGGGDVGAGVGGADAGVGGGAAPSGGGGGGGCSVGPKTGFRAVGPFALGLAFAGLVWARRRARA